MVHFECIIIWMCLWFNLLNVWLNAGTIAGWMNDRRGRGSANAWVKWTHAFDPYWSISVSTDRTCVVISISFHINVSLDNNDRIILRVNNCMKSKKCIASFFFWRDIRLLCLNNMWTKNETDSIGCLPQGAMTPWWVEWQSALFSYSFIAISYRDKQWLFVILNGNVSVFE